MTNQNKDTHREIGIERERESASGRKKKRERVIFTAIDCDVYLLVFDEDGDEKRFTLNTP